MPTDGDYEAARSILEIAEERYGLIGEGVRAAAADLLLSRPSNQVERPANATGLIAAAPDLLEALKFMVEVMEEPPPANCSCHIAPPCSDCVDHGGERWAFKDARAAIAKATGGAL